MDIKAMKASRSKMAATATKLAEKPSITPAEDAHLSTLLDSIETLDGQIRNATEAIKQTITDRAAGYDDSPNFIVRKSAAEVFSAESRDSGERADMARRAADIVEAESGREVRSDVKALFANHADYGDQFRAASSPDYRRAWAKIVALGEAQAMMKMTDDERSAVSRVAATEARTMSVGVDSAGGYLVPTTVNPEVLLNNTGGITNLRSLARVVATPTETWRGIASTGVTAAFTPEGSEVADGTPTLLGPTITTHKAACFIPFTFELADDWEQLATSLGLMMSDAKDRLEIEKFITGSGTNEPWGLVTRLEANTAADVTVTTAGTIGAVDIYNLMAAVPARFRPNTSWLMEMSSLNRVRQINTDGTLGTFVADLRAGYGFQLLGRPVYEQTAIDPLVVNSTAAATYAVVGDFSKAYTVVDRVGSLRVSMVPHLMGTTNNRPVGASGMYAYWRVGGDVLTGSTSGECGARILINKTS